MDHLAIMKKSWRLKEKILTGRKSIESRWYSTKYPPFDRIKKGDTVYFKDSSEPVTVKAEVSVVKQFSDLSPDKVRDILNEYGKLDGIEGDEINKYFEMFKDKKYCILVFLENPVPVKPFKVDKKGYGMMSSWLCLKNIDDIRK